MNVSFSIRQRARPARISLIAFHRSIRRSVTHEKRLSLPFVLLSRYSRKFTSRSGCESFSGAPFDHRKRCSTPSASVVSQRSTPGFAPGDRGADSNSSTHANNALWSPGFAPSTKPMSSSFSSRTCGPFDARPSSTTTSGRCGCSRRSAVSRRFDAFRSQSFFLLRNALAAIKPPVRHLDFETFAPAIPRFAGTRPYDAIPFLFSVHKEHDGQAPARADCLHEGDDDARPTLAKRLLDALGEEGTICVYSNYERRMLRELAAAVPQRATALAAIEARLFDLLPVVRNCCYHPDFRASFSIDNAGNTKPRRRGADRPAGREITQPRPRRTVPQTCGRAQPDGHDEAASASEHLAKTPSNAALSASSIVSPYLRFDLHDAYREPHSLPSGARSISRFFASLSILSMSLFSVTFNAVTPDTFSFTSAPASMRVRTTAAWPLFAASIKGVTATDR